MLFPADVHVLERELLNVELILSVLLHSIIISLEVVIVPSQTPNTAAAVTILIYRVLRQSDLDIGAFSFLRNLFLEQLNQLLALLTLV